MPRVSFKFNNGKERNMPAVLADVLSRRGMREYLTRDMVASARPVLTAVEVDSAGEEWNADLHVATKLKNQNGTWRKKPVRAFLMKAPNEDLWL